MHLDEHYIEQHDVIRRYHQNRLSEEELGGFEVYLIEHPELLRAVEEERILQQAFKSQAHLLDKGRKALPLKDWAVRAGLAASLLLAIVVVLNNQPGEPELSLRDPVTLESFRGIGAGEILVDGGPVVQFRFDAGPPELLDSNAFTAELDDAMGNTLYQATGLKADEDGWVMYTLPGQRDVLTGKYQVKFYPDGQPGRATEWSVEFFTP